MARRDMSALDDVESFLDGDIVDRGLFSTTPLLNELFNRTTLENVIPENTNTKCVVGHSIHALVKYVLRMKAGFVFSE